MSNLKFALATMAAWSTACGSDAGPCDPIGNAGCDDGLACEVVEGGEPACFAPVVVEGRVFDLGDDGAVAGARVVALDANNAAASSVSVSETDGSYRLALATTRHPDGSLASGARTITLRADAGGYLTFPSGIRLALPIDTSSPTLTDGAYVISSALTDVGLIVMATGSNTAAIHGKVAANATGASVLVVAESSSASSSLKGFSAIADRDGDYKILNLAPGDYSVRAYAQGHNYATGTTSLTVGQDANVDLAVDPAATSTLSGSVQIVNGGTGNATSVILVVESTFNQELARGEAPAGLRAPDVGGAFLISGIPAGRYVVLAAFENDLLVRDASSIGGTDIVHQEIAAGQNVMLSQSFKVTGALEILGPGANGPEAVTANPTLRWVDDSSEDRYELTVFDAFGTIVWQQSVPGGSNDLAVPYAGPALQSGMYYQFRARSIKDPAEEISRTEDLRGVFYLP